MTEESTMKLTDFDYLTGDHRLQMLKAALPYVDIPQQRFLSIFVKFQELRRTISLFEEEETAALGICSLDNSTARSPLNMLEAMKPFGNPEEQDFLDMICNLMQGICLGNQYQETKQPELRPSLDQLKNLLPPEQQNRFETVSLMMQAMQQLT